MGVTVVTLDVRGLPEWSQYVGDVAERVAWMALRDAGRAGRAEASRQIRDRRAVKPSKMGKLLELETPTRKQVLRATITGVGVAVPVALYKHKATKKKGVTVEIKPGSSVTISDAFAVKLRSDHYGVFRRKGPKRRMGDKSNYAGYMKQPIDELFSTRVSEAFGDILPYVQIRARERFVSTFKRLAPLEAAKRKR